MSNTLPLTISMGSLPAGIAYTPQQLADAIAARLSITTQASLALFASGSTKPSSNVGPWLKNGTTWYVWSNTVGDYVPQTIAPESLGYIISSTAPDPATYAIWIETTVGGSPLSIKTYYSGAWVDVYAATLTDYYTSAQTDAAIATAIGAAVTNFYVGVATLNAPQTIPIDAADHKMTLDAAQINAAGAIVLASARYVAPVSGNYHMDVTSQFDNDTGTASGMQIVLKLYKNGSVAGEGIGSGSNIPSPSGSRWFPGFGGIIALAQNDYIEVWANITDGVDTGNITLTTWDFSVFKC